MADREGLDLLYWRARTGHQNGCRDGGGVEKSKIGIAKWRVSVRVPVVVNIKPLRCVRAKRNRINESALRIGGLCHGVDADVKVAFDLRFQRVCGRVPPDPSRAGGSRSAEGKVIATGRL